MAKTKSVKQAEALERKRKTYRGDTLPQLIRLSPYSKDWVSNPTNLYAFLDALKDAKRKAHEAGLTLEGTESWSSCTGWNTYMHAEFLFAEGSNLIEWVEKIVPDQFHPLRLIKQDPNKISEALRATRTFLALLSGKDKYKTDGIDQWS